MVKIKYEKNILEFDKCLVINQLKHEVSSYLQIPSSRLKFIYKGKVMTDEDKLNNSMTLLLVASAEVLCNAPEREERRGKGGKYHVSLKTMKASSVKSISPYGFQSIETLSGFADRDKAYSILESLANDAGVLAVMEKHKWTVGSLCELMPDGQVGVDPVCVLGLNQNQGHKILLRIRTDDLKGFRKILSIKKVLYHELAHNVFGDHDDKFYMLMRQIEKEATELNWRNSKGRSLGPSIETHAGFHDEGNLNQKQNTVFRLNETVSDIDAETQELLNDASTPAEKAAIAALLRSSCTECASGEQKSVNVSINDDEDNMEVKVSESEIKRLMSDDDGDRDRSSESSANIDVMYVKESEKEFHEEKNLKMDMEGIEGIVSEQTPTTASSSSIVQSTDTVPPVCSTSFANIYELLTQNIDQFIAEAIALSSGLDDRMTMMREALCKFLLINAQDQDELTLEMLNELSGALAAIQKIIDKAKSSDDPKYRSINSTSRTFIQRIQTKNAIDVLIAAGFTKDEDKFVMNRYDPALLYCMSSLLDRASTALISAR